MRRLSLLIRKFDWMILLGGFVLFAIGLAAIFSVELSRGSGDFTLVWKQSLALLIGLCFGLLILRLEYRALRVFARPLYLLGVLAMIAVLIFGRTLNGSTGWFVVGGFAFQPIEFMKFALMLELARYFGEHATRAFGWRDFFHSGLIALVPALLALTQPDLGGALLLFGAWLCLVFFAGAKLRHVGALALVAALLFAAGWLFVFQDYQRARLETFLSPVSDPLGEGYNVAQAKIAIGAGGLLGRGLGAGSQSQLRFLPQAEADFVFAVIAEELGFFGVTLVLGALALVLSRMIRTARLTQDTFGAFLALGGFSIFFVQAVVHIGANLSLLPATGVALPLVSYGGSALLLSVVLLAVVESVAAGGARTHDALAGAVS